jgi:hypothetical protein
MADETPKVEKCQSSQRTIHTVLQEQASEQSIVADSPRALNAQACRMTMQLAGDGLQSSAQTIHVAGQGQPAPSQQAPTPPAKKP